MAAPVSPHPHPFRPRLAIRVGITGHRWDKIKRDDAVDIGERFDQVFDTIEGIVDKIQSELPSGYRNPNDPSEAPPGPLLRVFSGLAEGTDRIGAGVARRSNGKWWLTAMLPFARKTFELDFKLKKRRPDGTEVAFASGELEHDTLDPESIREFRELLAIAESQGGVQELDGVKGSKGSAYAPLASALCLNSDLVIAVWDGDKARPGGTGDVVALAREYGIPVVRIPVDGGFNPWIHTPDATAHDDGQNAGLDGLERHLRRLLVAPPPPKGHNHGRRDLREEYFEETARRERLGRIYDAFFNLISRRGVKKLDENAGPKAQPVPSTDSPEISPRDVVARLEIRWRREWAAQGVCDDLCSALLTSAIHKHYAWASHLANYYGGLYRSAFLTNYMFAWLAVAAAAVGVMFHSPEAGKNTVTLIAAAGEVGLLFGIVFIVWRSKLGRFHTRWLDYRRLAELIRSLPMLLPLGRTPVLRVEPDLMLASQETWVEWMFRAVMRETGVLPIDVTRHVSGARGILADGILKGQIDYHHRTAERNAAADRLLHSVTTAIFITALVLAVIHLTDLALHATGRAILPDLFPEARNKIAEWLLLPALVLPAIGAALHGLRSQGDYELTATRSERIGRRLEELAEELARYPAPGVGQVAEVAMETATAMNAELSAWLMAYQRKGIGLVV